MTTPSVTLQAITRQAVPIVVKVLLKLFMAILIAGHLTVPCGWTLRLFADVTIQCVCHLSVLVGLANVWRLSYELPWHTFAAAINSLAN